MRRIILALLDMTVKTLFEPDSGKILGAQIVGFEGVDKRIDVLAAAIHAGMTAADLEELDLAYAPPFSSAKDPVNMAGFVIQNVRSGLVRQFHWHDVGRPDKTQRSCHAGYPHRSGVPTGGTFPAR